MTPRLPAPPLPFSTLSAAAALALLLGLVPPPAQAQAAAPPAPASPAASAPPAAAAPPQRIEITGGRESDTEQRRRATASKIVIGREEIEAFGDGTVGEVLRRLPGVTTPGTPGRGGPPRMRGLGSGYTQLLIDGQPIPRGFSLESLSPDQVERIEVLRAPTAETGARAIAGTINIVLREGYRQRLNDLRVGAGADGGRTGPGLNWTRNHVAGDLTTNLSASVFERHSEDRSRTETRTEDTATGTLLSDSSEQRESENRRQGVSLSGRLNWRLGAGGDMLMLSPSVFHADNEGRSSAALAQPLGTALYDRAEGRSSSTFTVGRLNGQWRQRLASGLRIELGGTGSRWQADSASQRDESLAGVPQRRIDDEGRTRETSLTLNGKATALWGGDDARPGSEHSLVAGGEIEATRRDEQRSLRQDGVPLLADFGDNLQARSTRTALYVQDEWSPSPQWSTYAGLRWEGIVTEGDVGDGTRPRNRNSVWTPLAHAVWKPDPKSRSQVRASLTRSWRAPPLTSLIARPSINSRFPVNGPNEPTQPDRAGNPALQPELATGIDLAVEHYPADGGVLSASVFHRRIRDLMRSVTTLETVSWSPVPRWVARMQNIGDATTSGVELEAKGRLDQWRPGAPRVELRANLSVFDSRVDGVPGPDNRLDQQARGTANLGGDYKLPGWPLKVGGNLNWVPAYETQTSDTQRVGVSTRRVFDVYGLWTLGPAAALRLNVGNLAPRDSDDFNRVVTGGVVETARTVSESTLNWQLRLELKL